MSGVLSAESIEAALRGRFGRPLRYHESVGSTNDDAMQWAVDGAVEGAVVVTDHQTAGRGRWGRSWNSEPGRLLQFSTVLRPRLPVREAGVITTAVGVAAARAIEEMRGIEVGLKWPNDVTIERRKVAGILVESRIDDHGVIDVAIAGVGINVNWDVADMPEEIRDRATSISHATSKDVDRAELLASFLAALEAVYANAKADLRNEVIAEAVLRSDVIGETVTIRFLDGTATEGRAVGIDPTGALRVDTDDGVRTVPVGEIEQLRST